MLAVHREGNSFLPFGGLITRIFEYFGIEHRDNEPTVTPLGNYNKSTIQKSSSQIASQSSLLLATIDHVGDSARPSSSRIPPISSDFMLTLLGRIDGLWKHVDAGFTNW